MDPITLTNAHGKFLTAELDGSLSCRADATAGPGPWEQWTFEKHGPQFAIKSHHGGYLRVEGGGGGAAGTVVYDSPGPWELFEAELQDDGTYAIACHNGINLLTADPDGHVKADAVEEGPWERWIFTPDPFASVSPIGGNRVPKGEVWLQGRVLTDDNGPFLSLVASLFCAPRLFRDYKDRWDANCAWLQQHGFTGYRALVTTGGWPAPDAWEHAGAFLPWALDVLPQFLDDAYTRYNLRCSLTLFDGENQTPGDSSQDQFVNDVCDRLLPRMHTLSDVQVANEYGPTGWAYKDGVLRLRRHAQKLRSRLGSKIPIAISSRTTAMNDAPADYHVAESYILFYGLVPDVVTVTCNHDSRQMTLIDGPWRHVRQGWERVVSDPTTGQPIEPDASIDDEPAGPCSSVAVEESPSRIVSKAITSWISGRHQYCFHTDAGIWSDLLHDAFKDGIMGAHRLIEDHPPSPTVGEVFAKLVPLLPPDITVWSRTRHGLVDPPHPFNASFEQDYATGGFSQIWPDGITDYGVVRAYAAVDGLNFVVGLMGVKDRFEMSWEDAMEFEVFALGTGECWQTITSANGGGTLIVPESVDTDYLVIGRYL